MLNKFLCCAWMVMIFTSCGRTPETYVSFVNNPANGLTFQRNIGKVFYKAQLLPADYQILLARGKAEISQPERDSLRAMYNSWYYIRFEVGGEQAPQMPASALQYDAVKDFRLVLGRDSLAAAFCQPIAGGRRNTFEYMLAFPREQGRGDAVTLVYDNPAWENPAQQFTFSDKNFDVTLF